MKIKIVLVFLISHLVLFLYPLNAMQTKKDDPEITAARKARDRALVEKLQTAVSKARKQADETKSFEDYVRLALFQTWLCEALESHQQDNKLFRQAAEEGVEAAEKAVELNPQSSVAHQLLGDLLSQLIPHVYGGGMRYGKRSTDELDKAIELDPKNINAYVSRAISYYYSPESFGGDKKKALEMLKKAVVIDPLEDSPHIWLALFYMDANQNKDALSEILLARKSNPERVFTNYVYEQINARVKDKGNKKKTTIKKTAKKSN